MHRRQGYNAQQWQELRRMKLEHYQRHRLIWRWRRRMHMRVWIGMLFALMFAAFLTMLGWHAFGLGSEERQLEMRTLDGKPAGVVTINPTDSTFSRDMRLSLPDGREVLAHWRQSDKAATLWRVGGSLLLVALAVGCAALPLAKRLMRPLESLRDAVDAWGEGDLSARVPVRGYDEVAQLAHRFNLAAARIEALVDAQKSLLANASHELRSPLARIRMSSGMLGDSVAPAAREELERSVGELDALIDEILLASRIDAPTANDVPDEEVDLTGLAAEECARLGIELEAEHVVIQGQPKLLRRLIRNLLENARRYGGEVGLSMSVKRREGEAELCVCDRGPGVPPEQRERIFEPFYRLPGASEREGGVGLGLSLVRSIARRHGGEAYCEARAGGGACFRVRLPSA
jgi:signal transduction histidine kinase